MGDSSSDSSFYGSSKISFLEEVYSHMRSPRKKVEHLYRRMRHNHSSRIMLTLYLVPGVFQSCVHIAKPKTLKNKKRTWALLRVASKTNYYGKLLSGPRLRPIIRDSLGGTAKNTGRPRQDAPRSFPRAFWRIFPFIRSHSMNVRPISSSEDMMSFTPKSSKIHYFGPKRDQQYFLKTDWSRQISK